MVVAGRRGCAAKVTMIGITNPIHLRASHCKPWGDSSNEERINGENGLLLTPTIDHLFGRGFISFEDSGVLIVSPVAHAPSLKLMGLATDHIIRVGTFTQGQNSFLITTERRDPRCIQDSDGRGRRVEPDTRTSDYLTKNSPVFDKHLSAIARSGRLLPGRRSTNETRGFI
jgi:hypothetical protein